MTSVAAAVGSKVGLVLQQRGLSEQQKRHQAISPAAEMRLSTGTMFGALPDIPHGELSRLARKSERHNIRNEPVVASRVIRPGEAASESRIARICTTLNIIYIMRRPLNLENKVVTSVTMFLPREPLAQKASLHGHGWRASTAKRTPSSQRIRQRINHVPNKAPERLVLHELFVDLRVVLEEMLHDLA